MSFEEYRDKMYEEYEYINSINAVKFEMPNDIELLKMYISGKVFIEYELEELEELHKQLMVDEYDDIEIDWDELIDRG